MQPNFVWTMFVFFWVSAIHYPASSQFFHNVFRVCQQSFQSIHLVNDWLFSRPSFFLAFLGLWIDEWTTAWISLELCVYVCAMELCELKDTFKSVPTWVYDRLSECVWVWFLFLWLDEWQCWCWWWCCVRCFCWLCVCVWLIDWLSWLNGEWLTDVLAKQVSFSVAVSQPASQNKTTRSNVYRSTNCMAMYFGVNIAYSMLTNFIFPSSIVSFLRFSIIYVPCKCFKLLLVVFSLFLFFFYFIFYYCTTIEFVVVTCCFLSYLKHLLWHSWFPFDTLAVVWETLSVCFPYIRWFNYFPW